MKGYILGLEQVIKLYHNFHLNKHSAGEQRELQLNGEQDSAVIPALCKQTWVDNIRREEKVRDRS